MRLSREEFWVLDVTAQLNASLPIASLNQPNADLIFNKPRHHGLTANQLADLLVTMQKQGDLAIYKREKFPEFDAEDPPERAPQVRVVIDYTPIWENPVFYPQAAIFEDFFLDNKHREENRELPPFEKFVIEVRGSPLCFCMTRQGAEKWEEAAQVDWDKYLDCWVGSFDDADLSEEQWLKYGRAAALSKQTLDAYFDWKTRWDAHPDSYETSSFRRYHTEKIAPWKATYWKTFPEGFECDFWEYTVYRTEGMDKEESDRHQAFSKEHWEEHDALFDWCNDKYL